MKKLLSSLILLTLVMAFAGTASATIIYQEDFSVVPGYSFSPNNWEKEGDSFLSILQGQDLLYMTTAAGNSKYGAHNDFSLNMQPGKQYYVYVDIVAINTFNNSVQLGFYNGDNYLYGEVFHDIGIWFGDLPDMEQAVPFMTRLEFAFDSNHSMFNDLSMSVFADPRGGTYLIGNVIWTDAPLGQPVPIPGALFLIAPGVAGLAALKRRMS